MAKFELKFLDEVDQDSYIKVEMYECEDNSKIILLQGISCKKEFNIWLDKLTAIKFAKTLRTEINKIKA